MAKGFLICSFFAIFPIFSCFPLIVGGRYFFVREYGDGIKGLREDGQWEVGQWEEGRGWGGIGNVSGWDEGL